MLGSDFYLKLVDHSQKIGNDLTLVQGAGGNTSFKNEEFLWVKASGTKLSHAKNKDIFVKLEQPAEAQMEDFEGYTSGTFASGYSLDEEVKDFTAKPIQPVSSNPSVLDLLYTTY